MSEIDWESAEAYLKECEAAYTEIGSSGAFAFRAVIWPARDRFNAGERTQELYEAINNISL